MKAKYSNEVKADVKYYLTKRTSILSIYLLKQKTKSTRLWVCLTISNKSLKSISISLYYYSQVLKLKSTPAKKDIIYNTVDDDELNLQSNCSKCSVYL